MKLTLQEKRKNKAEYMKAWRIKNPEKSRQFILNSKRKNPEKYKELQRLKYLRWKKEKPDRLKEITNKANEKYRLKKVWLLPEKRERNRILSQEWRLRNPGAATKRVREWRERNPEQSKLNRREWARNNPEKNRISHKNNRAKRSGASGSFTLREWEQKKKEYKHTCPSCMRKEPYIKLSVDHINPLILGGTNFIDNIQPLCMPCNSRKNAKFIRFEPVVV